MVSGIVYGTTFFISFFTVLINRYLCL